MLIFYNVFFFDKNKKYIFAPIKPILQCVICFLFLLFTSCTFFRLRPFYRQLHFLVANVFFFLPKFVNFYLERKIKVGYKTKSKKQETKSRFFVEQLLMRRSY